ncbi:restriction endonuclease subunit S [Vibrio vulnificus]|nr:restriction endonuclease subunit S [Vibrio vulnificus]EHU4997568.1 restriction endonuclease subunit S [Vibrio vulnificus]EHV5551617.1 restriction endonuclease subunit S [Vibrio vulnificus]
MKTVREAILRFPDFKGTEYTLYETTDFLTRHSIPVTLEENVHYTEIGIRSWGRGIFHKQPVTSKDIGNKRVFWLDKNLFVVNIVFAWEQAIAATSENEVGKIASHRFPMFRVATDKSHLGYLVYKFLTDKGKQLLELASPGGAGRNKTLGQKEFDSLKLYLPSPKEQQKIADFLTAVDTKINQITEKHRLLKEYKKGVMQQIFSQQLRFKDNDGKAFPEWEEKHFGEVFGRVTQKNSVNNLNVLTISAQKGLISQLEYFNKSVSAKDVSGYYLLRKGDFAYNKSYSQGYPMGAIKPLKFYDIGVVSTLYICFRPKKGFEEAYFEQFFDAGMLNREIAKIAQEGARNHGLLNVSVKEFFDDIKLLVPHQNEQQKIAQFLQALDSKIAAVSEQIEQTKQFKKGLLQQMFV